MLAWSPPWPWFLCFSIICLVGSLSFLYLLRIEGRHPCRVGSKRNERLTTPGLTTERKKAQSPPKAVAEDAHIATIPPAVVFKQELWQACYGTLHPGFLLLYRVLAFCYLTAIMFWDFQNISWRAFFFFTEWNFTMLILYFMIGTYVSLRACFSMPPKSQSANTLQEESYSPLPGTSRVPLLGSTRQDENSETVALSTSKYLRSRGAEQEEGDWLNYAMQACYQVALPMAILVDCVFWLVLFPEAVRHDAVAFQLTFVRLTQHALNMVVVSGEFTLNSLRFPAFRVAYMLIWSVTFVLFQWFTHDVLSWSWAYGFLVNNTPEAPIWYLGLLGFHLICYWLWVELHRVKQWVFPMGAQWRTYLQSTSDELHDSPVGTSVMEV